MKTICFFYLWIIIGINACFACPACNIHNGLHPSLEQAEDVFVGQILSWSKDKQGHITAQVKVVVVLKGTCQPGELMNQRLFYEKVAKGLSYIFCNPAETAQIHYPVLPIWLEDEVRFLLSEDLKISNPEDAILKLQGLSVTTNSIAEDYIKSHFSLCRDLLFKAYLKLYSRESKVKKYSEYWEEDIYNDYRYINLIYAILSTNDPESIRFMEEQIHVLSGETKRYRTDKYLKIPIQSWILSAAVGSAKDSTQTHQRIFASLRSKFADLKGSALRWFTFAITADSLAIAEELIGSLDPKNREQALWGIYDLIRWIKIKSWALNESDDVKRLRELALSLTDDPKIRELFLNKKS